MLKEFSDFIREKGVLGLAVAVIVGGSVTKVVTALVDDIISPLVGIILGKAGNLSDYTFTIPGTSAAIKYGNLISVLIDFSAVMFVIYLIFVKSPLNKLDKKAE